MTEEEMGKFLEENLNLDANLKTAVIAEIIEKGFRTEYDEWEQWRFVKQVTDRIWQEVKKLSENKISPTKREAISNAFPKPKDLKK